MFARQALRSAAPLRKRVRSYATDTPSKGFNATPWIAAAVAAGAVYFGYAYMSGGAEAVPALKEELKSVAGKADKPAPKAFTGGEQGFLDLKLSNVENVNHNTKRFRFDLPEKDQVSGLDIASAIITKFKAPDAEKPVIRPYTPVSDEGDRGYMDLLIKVYPNGPMSEHIHSMTPGQMLSVKGPIPKYPWSTNKHSHITLLAGGTGITPMYQLIRRIFNDPNETTKVSLVFGNIAEEDILLKKEFEELENKYPNRFRAFYTLDQPPESWPYGKGHIDEELLKTVLPGPKEENIKVFVCGPPGLCKAISGAKPSPQEQGELTGMLAKLGYTKDQVYKF